MVVSATVPPDCVKVKGEAFVDHVVLLEDTSKFTGGVITILFVRLEPAIVYV